mmetsp:Transcript_83563/g.237089  ORF Transcript_83563/g.237089 Transcript_83563/m.237089 type:complete len:409 (-) Transcript_83563:57-1283(-)
MPTSAAQVDVQAPPGLYDHIGGGAHPPWTAGPGSAGEPASAHAAGGDGAAGSSGSLHELKKQVCSEVVEMVGDQIEGKTAVAVDAIWKRGQRVMQQLQEQQKSQAEQLQGQLAACAESHRRLEQENVMLRGSLEALMKHLTIVFGTPPYMLPQPPDVQLPRAPFPPHFAQQGHTAPPTPTLPAVPEAEEGEAEEAEELTAAPELDDRADAPEPSSRRGCEAGEHVRSQPVPLERGDGAPEDPRAAALAAPAPQPPDDQSPLGSAAAAPAVAPPLAAVPAYTFSVKLRRADQVPVGLDLQGDADDRCLIVRAVRPDGAVEAWNRQCAGDAREIRPGDRIVRINDAEDPHSMGQECLTKFFLKVTVLRGGGDHALGAFHAPRGLRADADEFVPRVGARPAARQLRRAQTE